MRNNRVNAEELDAIHAFKMTSKKSSIPFVHHEIVFISGAIAKISTDYQRVCKLDAVKVRTYTHALCSNTL